jgi:predicted unusual protein kinase regulating ubiquinone biosynthesis (AarF/ABC1/UbiB family)
MYWGGLAANIGLNAVGDAVKRSVGVGKVSLQEILFLFAFQETSTSNKGFIFNEANAKKLVDTLARMRGAALKLGQMLSIQGIGYDLFAVTYHS